jgi:hypothetical protein
MSTTFFHAILLDCERSFGCRMMAPIHRVFGRGFVTRRSDRDWGSHHA